MLICFYFLKLHLKKIILNHYYVFIKKMYIKAYARRLKFKADAAIAYNIEYATLTCDSALVLFLSISINYCILKQLAFASISVVVLEIAALWWFVRLSPTTAAGVVVSHALVICMFSIFEIKMRKSACRCSYVLLLMSLSCAFSIHFLFYFSLRIEPLWINSNRNNASSILQFNKFYKCIIIHIFGCESSICALSK